MKIAIISGQEPLNYIAALSGAEHETVIPPRGLSWHEAGIIAKSLAARCSGLLLSGGGDMQPELFGQQNTRSEDIDLYRDILELCALEAFVSLNKPVLGICRGFQVINVYFGGTLFQHIDGHGRINNRDSLHTVVWEGCEVEINSAHHQAVDVAGEGLIVTAYSGDGVVEAAVHRSLPVIGYQWHPERHEPTKEKIFKNFEYLCKST